MWKHEILETIQKNRIIVANIKIENQIEYFCNILEIALKDAQIFYFGDREDTILPVGNSHKGAMTLFPFNLPYNTTVFEYTCKNSKATDEQWWPQYDSPKRAIIAMANDEKQMFFNFNYMSGYNDWDLCPVYMMAEKSNGWMGIYYSMIKQDIHPSFTEKDAFQHGKEFESEMSALATMLAILNCQNVVTKDVLPPEKVNRKRIRNGKLPLYSYKILEVVKGKPKTKNAGSVPWDYKSPEAVRFHLCRGHFKTFTEERPLFGKYSGTFWWNPQSRGDKSKGVVEKEYKVSMESEQ